MKMKENHYSSPMFQAMPLPCLLLRPEVTGFVIVDANSRYLQLVNSTKEDLLGKKSYEAFPNSPHQRDGGPALLIASYEKVARTGEADSIELLRYDIPIRGTGKFEEKYWSLENIPVMGEKGQVAFVLHVVKDITAQILAENQGQQLQQQQEHFIENSQDGLYSLDVEGNFTTANEGLSAIAELPLPELLKMSFLPFCHPEDQEYILQHFHKAIAGQSTNFEAKFISARGRDMILQVNLIPMKVGQKIAGAYGIARDITTIKESQKIIVEKRNFLRANAAFVSNLLEKEGLENESLKEVFGIIGKAVDVDRMYYFNAHTKPGFSQTFISQKVEWTSERATPQIDNPELQDMSTAQVEDMLGILRKNEPFTAFPTTFPPGELREHFIEQDIKSLLLLPVFLKDALYGFIGFDDCTRERYWNQEEITFLQSMAHNLTTALEKRDAQTSLKQREEALIRSEKKFRALVQEGSDLIGILDLEGTYKFVSESSTKVLGIPPKDFLGKNAFDFIHPEDREALMEQFALLEKERQVKLGPFRFADKNNNWRWLESTATNLLDEPAINGIITNSRDITTLHDQAREIELINERYRLAATATRDLMYDWDLVADKVERFHKSGSFVGYNVEETNNRAFWREHVHPDELEGLQQLLSRTLNDPDRFFINSEYRFLRANGTYAHFLDRAYIIRDKKGKAIRFVGSTSDISELTSKKEALKVANNRFKMAMKATNEMIWDWDISTDRVIRSKALKNIFGYKDYENHPEKKYWLDKIHEEERIAVEASLSAALKDQSNKKWRKEYRFIRANGEIAHVIDRGFILRDEAGKAIRMVGAVLDVTGSRGAIERIEAQNRRLKEIAWEQSHVVRAPLARLQGLLVLLQAGGCEEMSLEEILRHIFSSADELDEIIRRIVRKTEEIEEDHERKTQHTTA